jgi:hypothetical protein
MTDEQINKAIVKAVGWESETSGPSWYEYETKRPNYCECLNAMQRVLSTMTDDQWERYVQILSGATDDDCPLPFLYWQSEDVIDVLKSTARKQAETFLKTLNLYIE